VRQPLSRLLVIGHKSLAIDFTKLICEEINVKKIVLEDGKELKVELDTKITPELKEEANARELVRKIQAERKKLGMDLTQEVNVWSEWQPKDKKLVQWLSRKAQIRKLEKGAFKVEKNV